MNRRVIPRLMLLEAVLSCLSFQSAHADEHYTLDKANTAIHYSADSFFGISEISGDFTEFDGDFVFCDQHPNKDRISVTLYSAGIHTPDRDHDEEIKGPHFFNAAQFPEIRFVSTKVRLTDENEAAVEGNLTLLGVTKPITMQVHFLRRDAGAGQNDYVVDFTASGVIQRSDFGMTYMDPFIGNEVNLRIEAKGAEEPKDQRKKTKP